LEEKNFPILLFRPTSGQKKHKPLEGHV
jgi:hypothetical protein